MGTKMVRKSIRFSQVEAQELSTLSKQSAIPEATLLRKWIINGIKAEKLERAIQAYQKRHTDLRGGAAMAGVSYNRFMREIEARNIVILDDTDHFYESLLALADDFDAPNLRKAVEAALKNED